MRALEFVQEPCGKLSATRLSFLVVAVVVAGLMLYLSILSGEPMDIPNSWIGVLALFLGQRGYQRMVEKGEKPFKSNSG